LAVKPASAATIAGLAVLLAEKTIKPKEEGRLRAYGALSKGPNVTVNYHKEKGGKYSNPPIECSNNLGAIIKLMDRD